VSEDLAWAIEEAAGTSRVVTLRVTLGRLWTSARTIGAQPSMHILAHAHLTTTAVSTDSFAYFVPYPTSTPPGSAWVSLAPIAAHGAAALGLAVAPLVPEFLFSEAHAVKAAAGVDFTCVLFSGGNVKCWGDGVDGRLGYGSTSFVGQTEHPWTRDDVEFGGGRATDITIGCSGKFVCVEIASTKKARCWGHNVYGMLGYGHSVAIGDTELPKVAGDVTLQGDLTQISAGTLHTCAILSSGDVQCWGEGYRGKLGYASLSNLQAPSNVAVTLSGAATQVAAGEHHTCAIITGGSVQCWGSAQ
jgi:hypothetical protein